MAAASLASRALHRLWTKSEQQPCEVSSMCYVQDQDYSSTYNFEVPSCGEYVNNIQLVSAVRKTQDFVFTKNFFTADVQFSWFQQYVRHRISYSRRISLPLMSSSVGFSST
ncbi:hypothetical protein J6590_098057 [Homalodisca vitripennis]|nr:hypothetical protein J6590_098057 [Homalodisca vitripennis]